MLDSSASLTQLTFTTPYKAHLPLLSSDSSARELLVSHHASSRTSLSAHTAWRHYSCFSAANSAFPYGPSSSPNTQKTNWKRSLKPKLHSTDPRKPIASPITVSKSTYHRRLFLKEWSHCIAVQLRKRTLRDKCLIANPSCLCAPLMTRLRNGSLVSNVLFLAGLICFRICLLQFVLYSGLWLVNFLLFLIERGIVLVVML